MSPRCDICAMVKTWREDGHPHPILKEILRAQWVNREAFPFRRDNPLSRKNSALHAGSKHGMFGSGNRCENTNCAWMEKDKWGERVSWGIWNKYNESMPTIPANKVGKSNSAMILNLFWFKKRKGVVKVSEHFVQLFFSFHSLSFSRQTRGVFPSRNVPSQGVGNRRRS